MKGRGALCVCAYSEHTLIHSRRASPTMRPYLLKVGDWMCRVAACTARRCTPCMGVRLRPAVCSPALSPPLPSPRTRAGA